jgi:hypothetical protein
LGIDPAGGAAIKAIPDDAGSGVRIPVEGDIGSMSLSGAGESEEGDPPANQPKGRTMVIMVDMVIIAGGMPPLSQFNPLSPSFPSSVCKFRS